MTLPRAVFPGRYLFITRSCTQRQFLLRPDPETNNAFMYCLAEASQRFEMTPILSQMMSNHEHTVLYDPHGREVEFRAHFYKMIAKSQNALRGRWENFWATEEPCVIELLTLEDLLAKLIYVATNPVKDGLVERVHQWPGPNLVSALLTGKTIRTVRPTHFFRADGPMPAEVDLVMKLPDHMTGKAVFLERLRQAITDVENDHIAARMKTGARVVGRACIRRQSWRDTPTSHEPRRGLRPRVAARSKWKRIAALQRNKEWQIAYRDAFELVRIGAPAEFPYGTYWLSRFANARVKPPPTAAD